MEQRRQASSGRVCTGSYFEELDFILMMGNNHDLSHVSSKLKSREGTCELMKSDVMLKTMKTQVKVFTKLGTQK